MSKKAEGKDNGNLLKDRLNQDLLHALSSKKSELKQQEEAIKEKEKKQRIEDRKRKEANKSFEELLAESDMDWRKFKS